MIVKDAKAATETVQVKMHGGFSAGLRRRFYHGSDELASLTTPLAKRLPM